MRRLALLGLLGPTACFNPQGGEDLTASTTTVGSPGSGSGSGDPNTNPSTTQMSGADASGAGSAGRDSGGDTADESTDAGTSCAMCVLAPPPGWTGPTAITAGTPPTDCASPFANDQLVVFSGFSDVPGSCDCGCGDPEMDCGDLELLYRQNCAAPIAAELFTETTPGTCYDNTPAQNSTSPQYLAVDQGSCPPQLAANLPAPAWAQQGRLCDGVFEQGQCLPGELCVGAAPDGFQEALCVHQAGDIKCPPTYPNKALYFTGVDDSRDCSPCTCTAVSGDLACSTTLQTYVDNNCDMPSAQVSTGTCATSWGSFEIGAPTIEGECQPGESTLSGVVTPSGLQTVCCS